VKKLISVIGVAATVLGAAAGSSASPQRAHSAKAGSTVQVRSGRLGRYLVDGRGFSLYLFEKDKGTTSACYGSCASYWPPYLTTSKPRLGKGLGSAKAGTVRRRDGKLQVTYGGHPLYLFALDKRAGQTRGQALKQFGAEWYVLSPAGRKIDRS
jgi:predicted lipoprotein with Yx(FWY)xxD motif